MVKKTVLTPSVILVLNGFGVTDTDPGAETVLRLKSSLDLWRQLGKKDIFVVTGGIYKGNTLPAGKVMGRWLKARGVPETVVVEETWSMDTHQNIATVAKQLQEATLVYVVTHWQHALRAWVTLHFGYGYTNVVLFPLYYRVSWARALLEWVYLLYHLLDPKGTTLVSDFMSTRRR